MTMNDNLQDAEARLENMNTQDIDMEVANIEDESIRLQLWKEIEHISSELDRPIRENRDDPIEVLEVALEKLEGQKVTKFAFSSTAKFAAKFTRNTQDGTEKAPVISPDEKCRKKNRKMSTSQYCGNQVKKRLRTKS